MDATCRAAEAADRPELVRLWRRAVEATHDFLAPIDLDRLETHVRDQVLPLLAVTVATVDGGLVGWVAVDGNRIEALFVEPAVHRRGIGRALLAAVTPGMSLVALDANEQNPSALAFYEAQGFVRTGRSPRDGDGRPFPLIHLLRR